MADNQRTWWQHWPDTTYIKPLNHMVGGTCLAALPKLGILGRDEALEDHTGSGGAVAALMGPLLTLAEGRSRALPPARGASAHQPPRYH